MDQKDKTAAKLREIALYQNTVKPYIPRVKVQQSPPLTQQDAAKRQKTGEKNYNQPSSPAMGRPKTSDPFYTPNKKHSADENHPATKSTPEMRNGLYINAETNQPYHCQTHRQDSHYDGPEGDCKGWWKNHNAKAAANSAHVEGTPPPAGSRAVPTHITDDIWPHKELTAEVINETYTKQHKQPQQLIVKPCSLCAALGDTQEQATKSSHAAIDCGNFRGLNCADAILKRNARNNRRTDANKTSRGRGGRDQRGGRGGRDTSQPGRGSQQASANMTSLSLNEDDTQKAYTAEMNLLESRWAYVPLDVRQRFESIFPPEQLNSPGFTKILMNRFKPTLKSINEETIETINPQSSNVQTNLEFYPDPYTDIPQALTPGRSNTVNPFVTQTTTRDEGEVEEDNKSETSIHYSDDGNDHVASVAATSNINQQKDNTQSLTQMDIDNQEFNFEPINNPEESSSFNCPTKEEEQDEIIEAMNILDTMDMIMDMEDQKTQSGDRAAMAHMAGSPST
jgi:hypothetical protein